MIEIGGSATGLFVEGDDSSRADPVVLDVRLQGISQEPWFQPNGSVGGTKFYDSTDAYWNEDGSGGFLSQTGICDRGDEENTTDWCERGWNDDTGRFEGAVQTIESPGISEWQSMVAQMADDGVMLTVVTGLPEENPDITGDDCGGAVEFLPEAYADLGAPAEIMLVSDRSRSMDQPTSAPRNHGETRMEYVKTAAELFINLIAGQPIELGLIQFNHEVDDLQDLTLVEPTMGSGVTVSDYVDLVNSIEPFNRTSLGAALRRAGEKLPEGSSNVQAVYFLTDAENNSPDETDDPVAEAQALKERGIRIFSLPVSNAADKELLGEVAYSEGLLDSPDGDELPATFTELFARARGEALSVERTNSAVVGYEPCSGGEFPCDKAGETCINGVCVPVGGPELPASEAFAIPIEAGAERLNLVLSSRNAVTEPWAPYFELRGPEPERVLVATPSSPFVIARRLFYLIQIPTPAAGNWQLEIFGTSEVPQESFLTAHVQNPAPGCRVYLERASVSDDAAVVIVAEATFNHHPLEGAEFSGVVRRPDESEVPLAFDMISDYPLKVQASFSDFVGRGDYHVALRCEVDTMNDVTLRYWGG